MREETHPSDYFLPEHGFHHIRYVLIFDGEALISAERGNEFCLIWNSTSLAYFMMEDDTWKTRGEELLTRAKTITFFGSLQEREEYIQLHYGDFIEKKTLYWKFAQLRNQQLEADESNTD